MDFRFSILDLRLNGRRRGFTLVELLVVIGVIALLLSLLLPALSKAKEAANAVACAANMRSIGQAMQMYAQEHKDYIPGSPVTSGKALWTDASGSFALKPGVSTITTPPPVIELYDYIGPLAQTMKLSLPDTSNNVERFRGYRKLRQFLCVSAEGIIATKFAGPADIENGQMLSYVTAMGFLLPPFKSGFQGKGSMPGSPYWTVPAGYSPKVGRVGRVSEKVYLAEGGRWSRSDSAPTFSMDVDGDHNNTNFSDFGAFWGITKSFDRSVPNKSATGSVDARLFAFRHGNKRSGGASGSYRLNLLFFDGHVEGMDDMTAANPALWLPEGTQIANPAASLNSGPVVWPDVAARYISTTPYVAP
jgi:prepilin-type N-terminal cleavage/methylation domain-containing protein/prepilin-type processing-associated H-X9-DG protein